MEDIRVSVDRIIIEYTRVSLDFFNSYIAKNLCDYYHANINPNSSKAFHYTVCFKENDGHYLHLSYKLMSEKKATHYTLWAETNPEYMVTFRNVFKTLSRNAKEINFVLCDVAFDIPYATHEVFLISRTGRKPSYYKNTTYYGTGKDRRKHGYCRFYDKKKQLREVEKKDVVGELSRVEMVYRPDSYDRFSMRDLLARSPNFNRLYQCHILTDTDKLIPKKKKVVEAIISRTMAYKELSTYQRGALKKDLSSQLEVNFDTLSEQQWKELINLYVSLACGW